MSPAVFQLVTLRTKRKHNALGRLTTPTEMLHFIFKCLTTSTRDNTSVKLIVVRGVFELTAKQKSAFFLPI